MKNKITKLTVISLTTISSLYALAEVKQAKIVYGIDNRIETYQASDRDQALASSTAGMIQDPKLVDLGDHFMLPPTNMIDGMGLCEAERFSDQPKSVICSGFLVGPDLLVTAGHCVTSQTSCDGVSFVFDYKIEEDSKRANIIVPKSSVYHCAKLLEGQNPSLNGNTRDFALIRLDRVVKGKVALKYRTDGTIGNFQKVKVIGHPSGLPQKIAGGAKVFTNDLTKTYFETNLDTFGGNSGSAVFNDNTGMVEGILVRGAKDYVGDPAGQCAIVNDEVEDITGRKRLGESVTRITDIASLKYLDVFMKAAASGDIGKVEELKALGVNLSITDFDKNSVLHIAAKNGQKQMMNYLIAEGLFLDAQNIKGETALHLAAFHNQTSIIKKLVVSGADLLIKDSFGVFASERTNFFSFKTRTFLRRNQSLEEIKRRK